MAAELPAQPWTLPLLAQDAAGCRGCDLYKNATQTVFGEGPRSSSLVLIGEQPGDEEDRKGHPFVGPAGRLLAGALEEAGIDRKAVYITNAVKHFKFEMRGKRRLHMKPGAAEIEACRPWLEAEIAVIRPFLVVCLGATAARSVFGLKYRVTKDRGIFVPHAWAPWATSTIHPSAILRVPDEDRRTEYARFVADLTSIGAKAQEAGSRPHAIRQAGS